MYILQQVRIQLNELCRRVRRLWARWQRRDPPAWVIALVGMAMGLCLLLITLAWLGVLCLLEYIAVARSGR
jgi:hypothetical protein